MSDIENSIKVDELNDYTLEELLVKYRRYKPIINVFNEHDESVEYHIAKVGWHCCLSEIECISATQLVHVRGKSTPKEALVSALIRMAERENR